MEDRRTSAAVCFLSTTINSTSGLERLTQHPAMRRAASSWLCPAEGENECKFNKIILNLIILKHFIMFVNNYNLSYVREDGRKKDMIAMVMLIMRRRKRRRRRRKRRKRFILHNCDDEKYVTVNNNNNNNHQNNQSEPNSLILFYDVY